MSRAYTSAAACGLVVMCPSLAPFAWGFVWGLSAAPRGPAPISVFAASPRAWKLFRRARAVAPVIGAGGGAPGQPAFAAALSIFDAPGGRDANRQQHREREQ